MFIIAHPYSMINDSHIKQINPLNVEPVLEVLHKCMSSALTYTWKSKHQKLVLYFNPLYPDFQAQLN